MRITSILAVLLPFVVMAWSAAPFAAAQEEARLELTHAGEARVGEPFEIVATLVTATDGAPIAGALVALTYPGEFAENKGLLVLARATTDDAGRAALEFEPRVAGNLELRADFAADGIGEGTATTTLAVEDSDKQLYRADAGISIFGEEWILIAVVSGVWLVLFAIALGIADIARSGLPAATDDRANESREEAAP